MKAGRMAGIVQLTILQRLLRSEGKQDAPLALVRSKLTGEVETKDCGFC